MAGGLWATERTYRTIRTIRNNKFGTVQARLPAVRPFPPLPTVLQDSVDSTGSSPILLRTPHFQSSDFPLTSISEDDKNLAHDVESVSYDIESVSPPTTSTAFSNPISGKIDPTDREGNLFLSRPVIVAPPSIPLGYAQAQLLPGDTVRLTIRVPNPFSWAPGQSVLLCLPDLAAFQSHPFTIVNNDSSEITLLIKARKGLTRKLYEWVLKHRQRAINQDVNAKHQSSTSIESTGGDLVVQAPPVLLRAILDGPFGSADRVKWGDYSTVVIFCGGSGISFGASILEYICGQLSQVGMSTSPRFKTTRLRFCWIVREFAEVAWIASHLRRCHLMVLPEQVQIEIFVTRVPQATTDHGLRDRRDAIDGAVTDGAVSDIDSIVDGVKDTDNWHSTASVDRSAPITYEDPADLTNYDDETDIDDPEQQRLSSRMEQQGRLRRDMSRDKPAAAGPSAMRQTWNIDEDEKEEVHSTPGWRMPPPLGTPREASFQTARLPVSQLSYNPNGSNTAAASSSTNNTPWVSYQAIPSVAHSQDIEASAGRNFKLLSLATRTTGVVALDEPDPTGSEAAKSLWIDEADFAAMSVLSEVAHTGRPRIDAVIEEEFIATKGDVMVASKSRDPRLVQGGD